MVDPKSSTTNSESDRAVRPFRERFSCLIVLVIFLLAGLTIFVSYDIFGLFCFISFVLLGLDVVYINAKALKTAIAAKNWPSTKAKLLRADAVRKRYNKNNYKWFLELEYEYEVAGTTYKNSNYNWVGKVKQTEESMEKFIAAELKPPKILIARYNPSDPAQSVIHAVTSPVHIMGILVGLTMISAAVIGILDVLNVIDATELLNFKR